MTNLRWKRSFLNSAVNFDLALENSQRLNARRMNHLLDEILKEKHRVFLTGRAVEEFRRWFAEPDSALKSDAYVLLSNWFMTQGPDRRSLLASRCEDLWDALFCCRPPARLSSARPGRNHIVIAAEFHRFWQRLMSAQNKVGGANQEAVHESSKSKRKDKPALAEPPNRRQFDVVIERDEEGTYVGSVPSLPGCHTQAISLDELMERVREAIALYLEVQDETPQQLEFIGVQRITVAA
jgi:predicted RNase H-like HicB family nuclease